MADYIDSLIMFLAGAYATGVGFRWLASPAKGPSSQVWERRWLPLFRIIGPLMMAIAAVLTIAEMAR